MKYSFNRYNGRPPQFRSRTSRAVTGVFQTIWALLISVPLTIIFLFGCVYSLAVALLPVAVVTAVVLILAKLAGCF